MTTEQSPKLLRVSLVGMNERMQKAMRVFFKLQCKNNCIQVEDDSAQITVLDLDGHEGQQGWITYRQQNPERPTIVLSLKPQKFDDALFLVKPVKPDQLMAALSSLQGRNSPAPEIGLEQESRSRKETPTVTASAQRKIPGSGNSASPDQAQQNTHGAATLLSRDANTQVGTLPDINPLNPKEVANAHYRPEEFFQSVLKQALQTALEKNCYVNIESPSGDIILLPGGLKVQPKFKGANGCRALCCLPIKRSDMPVSVLGQNYRIIDQSRFPVLNAESLLWQTALFSARGRIPEGTSLSTPVFLSSWPNMTRNSLFPHAMRIASLWATRPYSLLDTARTLGIPQRFVFAFYSAAHALDKAGITRRASDMLFKPPSIGKNRKRGFFSRVLAKLGQHQVQRQARA